MLSLRLKLLLVSPDQRLETLIRALLDERPPGGHSLARLESLDQALVSDELPHFDVAIVDLLEPRFDWIGECKVLAPRLSIIVLTSEDEPSLGLAAIREGAQDYLDRRHLNADTLLRVIRYAAERARVEWALRESQAQLLQSQKMEAIGRMTAGLVHDFRQFTQVIVGDCGLLSALQRENPEVLELVEEIREAGLKARRLVEQLLNFARLDSRELTLCDLNDAVREHEGMVRSLLDTRHLHLELWDGRLPIQANMVQLGQVLLNLAVNAVDATAGDGWLTIRTRLLQLGRPYRCSSLALPPGNYALLELSDSGTGLAEELRSRVFEPFFTTKARGHGTGLGLSTVFSLAEGWGGWLDFGSLPGHGTTFRLVLPTRLEQPTTPPKMLSLDIVLGYGQDSELLTVRRDLEALGCQVTEPIQLGKMAVHRADRYLLHLERALECSHFPDNLIVVGPVHPRIARSALGDVPNYLMSPFSRAELAEVLGASEPPAETMRALAVRGQARK